MIVKYFDLKKEIKKNNNFYLLYGQNTGLIKGPKNNDNVVVWLSYNVHGNESSSTEASMKTAYELLKNKYNCYYYNFDKNQLQRLMIMDILRLKSGKILENKYKKNSVNVFFINNNKKKII